MQIIQRVARLIAVSGFILVAGSSWASEKLILTGFNPLLVVTNHHLRLDIAIF